MSEVIPTKIVRRNSANARRHVKADICVVGAGISGVAAALEAAKLGRKVVLIDGAPALGGQAVGSIIGTIIGLYTHGPNAYQITHGIADELISELTESGAILRRHRPDTTVVFQYDEVQLARWIESKIEAAGIQVLLGAVLNDAQFADGRLQRLEIITRFGPVVVEADGYVDASGDASLSWQAGLDCREPDEPVFGTLNFLIEGFDEEKITGLEHEDVYKRLTARGKNYGLVRNDGFLFNFPGKGFALANINHMETPLDPLKAANTVFEGRRQADNVMRFLKDEYPEIFAGARVRVYGNPGMRQTRWIVGRHQLTLDEIRKAERPDDAVARCAWWVELHDAKELVHWERFSDEHVHYIPLSCMVPKDATNIVAAGRCVDADSHALSSIRVMGPCIAMGTAAAHALDLAGAGSLDDIDMNELQQRLYDNLERKD